VPVIHPADVLRAWSGVFSFRDFYAGWIVAQVFTQRLFHKNQGSLTLKKIRFHPAAGKAFVTPA
jgi:hypothetical protein